MKRWKFIILGALSFFIIILGSYCIVIKSDIVKNLKKNYAAEADKTGIVQNSNSIEALKSISPSGISTDDESLVYNYMHKMANSKIIAEDNLIWGQLDMKPSIIKKLIYIVSRSSFKDRKILLGILNRWNKNDFTKVDKDHNYVWKALGGTVGKAIGIKRIAYKSK